MAEAIVDLVLLGVTFAGLVVVWCHGHLCGEAYGKRQEADEIKAGGTD